jgi:hypothetical protein
MTAAVDDDDERKKKKNRRFIVDILNSKIILLLLNAFSEPRRSKNGQITVCCHWCQFKVVPCPRL